ncbi:hypothetical protein OR1_02626 [Geobacter sp. OR-1]|uniref:hypothetical protein n=1 Tax=Geobacter sp. OR-1 TaxID=1266765 RepID=UPI00054382C9|nr:hypothetical protein [Geobacter sp. OR-1]GAM10337.1 hypothetical protein OR1_02626 [Geobacter sp. OR-1]
MSLPFRHSAGFGKRMEYWMIGKMLKEGLDIYVPLVDDDAIDAVIRRQDGSFITVQIKARSQTVCEGDAALFAAIPHELRDNYWFVFYSERMDMTWIMNSEEFISEAHQNKSGKNKGKRSIWFNGKKKDKITGKLIEYCKPQFEKYVASNFERLLN